MNKKIKIFITSLLLVSFMFNGAEAARGSNTSKFNNKNIILKFASIADTHMQGVDQLPSKKLVSALEQLNKRAEGKLDAVVISGDLTDYGLPEQVAELKRVFEVSNIDLNKTRLVAALGNHEYYDHELRGAEWKGGYLLRDVFGDQAYFGALEADIKASNYHTVVNGIDFIAVNCVQYSGGVKYNKEDLIWLKEQLAKASADRPGKPVFVSSHPNITGTNFGSNEGDYWNAPDLYSILKEFPQVIYFCGHLHFPENDERSIWQGDFTSIGLGSTYYSSNHPVDDETGKSFIDLYGGYESLDAAKTSQGLYVEIDNNYNVRVTRLDFANKKEIKEPWVIPAPKSDKSHLKIYTYEQQKKKYGKTAPVFPSGSFVKVDSFNTEQNEFTISFTQARDNDLVYSYQISFIDKSSDKVLTTISVLSDFYLHANASDMFKTLTQTITKADSVLAPFKPGYQNDYIIKVVAVDCFGNKSKPVISKLIKAAANKQSLLYQFLLKDEKAYSRALKSNNYICNINR